MDSGSSSILYYAAAEEHGIYNTKPCALNLMGCGGVKRYSTSTSDYEEYCAGRMVGLFITGGGPNSSYDTLFINGFRGTRRFTTLNNVDIMVENGERGECYRCMGVAEDEREPLQSSRQIRSKSRRGSSSPSFPPPRHGRAHAGPVETFVVDRRLPKNF
ncbi:hypothetical protein QTP88_002184 [Uroleucon formosanum]